MKVTLECLLNFKAKLLFIVKLSAHHCGDGGVLYKLRMVVESEMILI